MFKLTVVLLALAITYTAAQTESSDGGGGGGGSCEDASGFVGTQPQNKGKTCAEQSPDNCKFIDESIQKCCATCQNRQNETPGPATAAPNNNGPGKGGKKKGCFHGNDMVQTKEYGTISISQLADKRDAHVLTRNDDGQLEYSSVRYWLHAQPEKSMKFYTLSTESGHKLAITSEHLIYETDCQGNGGNAIYAKNVQVGRCLYVNENGQLRETRVVEKGQEKMNGIYSPITTTGSIVVNDVLASCYNYYENESLQKLVYQYVIGFQDMLANWLPSSLYQAAFNDQNGAFVTVPRLVFNFLQLSNVFVH
jgi:hypothetical protein